MNVKGVRLDVRFSEFPRRTQACRAQAMLFGLHDFFDCGTEAEAGAGFARRRELASELLDQPTRVFDELRIAARKPTLCVVDGILHSDAQIAAEQVGLRQHRKGVSADAETRPCDIDRQNAASEGHGLARRLKAVSDPENQARDRRSGDDAPRQQILHEMDVADAEQFEFRFDARLVDHRRHFLYT